MGAELQLNGMDDLMARIRRMAEGQTKVENKMLRAGAEIIQQAASNHAPRSKMSKRHLADFIMISRPKTKYGIRFVEIGPTKGDNSEFFYGKFLEWGTLKMAARPFMGPALAESQRAVYVAMVLAAREEMGL